MIDIGPSISGLREQTEYLTIQATTLAHRTVSPETKASFLNSINTVKAMVEEKLEAVREVYTKSMKTHPFDFQPFNFDELGRDINALTSLESTLSSLLYPYQSSALIIRLLTKDYKFSAQVTLENTTTVRELRNISADIFAVPAESLRVSVYGDILNDEQEFMALAQSTCPKGHLSVLVTQE
jgi:hypothetical protein